MLEKIGGRKVMFGFIFLTVGVVLAYTLGDVPSNLMQFMIFLSAGFFLGNGVEHVGAAISNKGKDSNEFKSAVVSDLNILNKKIEEMNSTVKTISKQATINAEAVEVAQKAVSTILDQTGLAKKND